MRSGIKEEAGIRTGNEATMTVATMTDATMTEADDIDLLAVTTEIGRCGGMDITVDGQEMGSGLEI
jgi:hypothetical protein